MSLRAMGQGEREVLLAVCLLRFETASSVTCHSGLWDRDRAARAAHTHSHTVCIKWSRLGFVARVEKQRVVPAGPQLHHSLGVGVPALLHIKTSPFHAFVFAEVKSLHRDARLMLLAY